MLDYVDQFIHDWTSIPGWPAEAMVRLIVAALLGGLIGLEREVRGRQAGLRTNMLVCIGSALVMIVSIQFASHGWQAPPGVSITVDPARIAYGVMTGVGFLGAGTIIQNHGSIKGLTTAAGVWCVAAVGLAVGFGLYLLSVIAAVLIVLALWVFDYLEVLLPNPRFRTVTVRTAYRPGFVGETAELFRGAGLDTHDITFERGKDLSQVDVHIATAFRSTKQYMALEKAIQGDPRFELISSRT